MASPTVKGVLVMVVVMVSTVLPPIASQNVVFPAVGCIDSDRQCPQLAAAGTCVSHPTYMRNVCPLSCNLCDTTTTTTTSKPETVAFALSDSETETTTRRTITNPDFKCGGPTSSHSRTPRQATVEDPPLDVEASRPVNGAQVVKYASCGASPISNRFLLTAAYCVLDPEHPVTSVRLGDLDLSEVGETNSKPADYDIIEIFLPPAFNESRGMRYHDIALLKTDREIEFNDAVFPYCVSSSPPSPGTSVIAAGFGHINETHKSSHLMEGKLKVLSLAQCEKEYLEREEQRLRSAYPDLLQGNKGLICAGDVKSGVCEGDEGGPLFREDQEKRRFLEGIISFTGSVCADGVLPGVFTAVADYVEFIDNTIYGKPNPSGR